MPDRNHFDFNVLDSLINHIAVLDAQGIIVAVNRTWREFGEKNSLADSSHGVGMNYLEICKNALNYPHGDEAEAALAGILAVLSGEKNLFQLEYPCHSPDEKRWFLMTVCSGLI